MMELFIVYVIMCFASTDGCADYAPSRAFSFETKEDCTVFAYKLLEAGQRSANKQGWLYVDGKAFCLRFTESKET